MRGSLGVLATRSARLLELVILLRWMPTDINAFSILPSAAISSSRLVLQPSNSVTLSMGLFDTLFPQPSEDEFFNSTIDNAKVPSKPPMKRLFSFRFDGTEKNDFLPCLSRSLDSGLGPLVSLTDDNVETLATDVGCLPEDAAWALEACRGDVAEAMTRILNAQKLTLERRKDPQQQTARSTKKVNANETLGQFREQLQKQEEQTRKRVESLSGGTPDADWLPMTNPKPVDDEPWFTG